MSADQTIIEALPFRFLQVYVHSVPTYNKESLQRVLKGYEVLGEGAFTVALYNEELRKKYESQIILISQDVSKEIMSYIHMRYPKNPHFPAFKLLGQSISFPSYIKQPEFLDVHKRVFLYSVPEYDSLMLDRKNQRWYAIPSEKTKWHRHNFWQHITDQEMKPIDDKKTIAQVNFVLSFYASIGTENNYEFADSKTSSVILSQMVANKDQESIKNAFKILIEEHGRFNKPIKKLKFYWDFSPISIPDDEHSLFSEKRRDFFILYNIAIDKSAKNLVLLDPIYYADSQSAWGRYTS